MVKVSNDDEGEDLGLYESDYLPRVGEDFALWHPRVCKDPDIPFLGVVESVTHEAYCGEPPGPEDKGKPVYAGRFVGSVHATVWLIEQHAPPTLYCVCTEEDRKETPVVDGYCDECRGVRS